MSDNSDNVALHPTLIDIPLEIRLHLIQLLNQTLACTNDLRSQVKHASWNVKGKESSLLRSLFNSIASELETYADLAAERITVLGGVALGTVRAAAEGSMLPGYPGDITDGEAHVRTLVQRFALSSRAVRNGISRAADVEDTGTAALYTDISRGMDKQLSCLEAHLR